MKVFAENRKARNSYEFQEFYEAGIVLTGPETKSVRTGAVSIVANASIIERAPFLMLFVSAPVRTIPASKNSRNSYEFLAFLFCAKTFIDLGNNSDSFYLKKLDLTMEDYNLQS